MEKLAFFPIWPPTISDLGLIGLLLLCSVVFGELARHLKLPRIIGYVLSGILLSPGLAGFWSVEMLQRLQPFYSVAFGLVLFELGQRTDLGWLRRNPWLLATSITESLLAFLCAGLLLWWLSVPPVICLLTAGLASATGPSVILGITKENRARGQVTERLYLLSALGSCYTFITLGVVYVWMHYTHQSVWWINILHPLYLIGGSILLGALAARCIAWALSWVKPSAGGQTLRAVTMIVVTVALVDVLKLSVVITLLVAGVLYRTIDHRRRLQPVDFGLIGQLALIVIFASTGALLQLSDFAASLIPALGLIGARALGKYIGVFLFARPSGLSMAKASLLSMGLLPMSGAALVWMESAALVWPEFGRQLAAIMLTALVMMELLGPLALQYALKRAGETTETDE